VGRERDERQLLRRAWPCHVRRDVDEVLVPTRCTGRRPATDVGPASSRSSTLARYCLPALGSSTCPEYFFSPASTLTRSRFSGRGIGQVVKGLNAHGGLYASLKSTIVVP